MIWQWIADRIIPDGTVVVTMSYEDHLRTILWKMDRLAFRFGQRIFVPSRVFGLAFAELVQSLHPQLER